MKFLLDANIPYSSQTIFARYGEVWHVRDVELANSPDAAIAQWAFRKGAIIVTRDLDFSNPHLIPKKSLVGLIILRVPHRDTAKEINTCFASFLRRTQLKTLAGRITIIESGRIRQRKL